MEKLSDKTWDETQAKLLTICFKDSGDTEFKASNIIFEGHWIIFFDVDYRRIRAFPSHRILGIDTT